MPIATGRWPASRRALASSQIMRELELFEGLDCDAEIARPGLLHHIERCAGVAVRVARHPRRHRQTQRLHAAGDTATTVLAGLSS